MIYVTIPSGMVFKKIAVQQNNSNETEQISDCFVTPEEGTIIDLQNLVKEALRTNSRRKNCINLKDITIYLNKPPATSELFLAYTPNHNGKHPTEIEPKVITGREAHQYDPKQYTRYGSFWYQQIHLSADRQSEIEEKMSEQKANRRHIGYSPLST
ncbi:permease [Legionella qingyii]|uniref:Permease n=1 Tax=Legionella qingyii TaxID=2184757 RepID=A0A317U4I9_9GAMM|nr:permease [Legionella qingyii]PWY56188.1 permease [Legionella qingyii]RUR22215.1 permease [Legionella qingyii]RUR25793.1 permease [Legionella qingyii]